jgi:hypothetical protein
MPEGQSQDSINSYSETSTSSPVRTSPNKKQMGLGTHEFFTSKANKEDKKKKNS